MNTAAPDWTALAAALHIASRIVIDGQRRHAASGETFSSISPINGRVLGAVACGAQADVDAAVGPPTASLASR